jgi:cytoskeletal protein CcmA (bactofilin family)
MAQIIKHRRGSISALKDVSANIGELVMGTGSIGDLNAPVLFIGDTAVAGGYKPVSKIYQGTTAPTISVGSHGSTMDGLPFYSTGTKTLYILDKGGNSAINLTGNIEGNTISGVTINSLTGINANITSVTGSNGNFSNLTGTTFTSTNGNITSLTGSNANVTNITGSTISGSNVRVTTDMSVGGKVVVAGDISGSNLNLTGNATIDGDIVLKGNISIGNQTTDLVTFGADVSSSILPDVNNAFDLGSTTKYWRDLYVSGTAYIDELNLGSIQLTNLDLPGYLNVTGATTLGGTTIVNADFTTNGSNTTLTANYGGNNIELVTYNGATIDLYGPTTINGNTVLTGSVKVTGSIYNDQLTNNRVVIVGANGLLEDDANFTFDGSKLNIGVGSFEVDTDGDVRTSGSLLVKNSATVTGSLNVSGSTNLVGPVDIQGDTKMTGSLNVTNIKGTGSLYLQPDQNDGRYFEIYNTAASDVHIKSSNGLSFFGDDTNYLKIDDNAQTVTIVGVNGVSISSSLDVTGSSILSSTLQVKGATGLNSTLDVTGSATLKSTLQVDSTSELKGAVGMNSTLDVTGSAQFKSTINVDSEATLASATVEDLTQDRIVTVGAGGSLIDSSGFTYNGTVFKIGDGQFEVDTNDGDVRTSGSLTVEGGQTVNGDVTINGVLTVTGNTQLQANLYVSGNLEVLGGATSVTIQSTTVELDDNIIRLNAYSPFERYAGFEVIDSGSTGVSASLVWDGLNDYWMFVSSSGESSKLLGTTAGTYGSETSLTATYFPIATGPNTIGDSLLRYSGTTLSFNTNKFTIDSGTGDTLVSGNFTLSYSGGTDNGTKTSAIMFRNSTNVVGFVSTTETTDVLDGILGYKNSDGTLKFSTVIDGGSY